jgi:hypothetical protein
VAWEEVFENGCCDLTPAGGASGGYQPWELHLSVRKIPHGAKPNALGTQLGEAVVNVSNFADASTDGGAAAAAAPGPGWGPSRRKTFQLSGRALQAILYPTYLSALCL